MFRCFSSHPNLFFVTLYPALVSENLLTFVQVSKTFKISNDCCLKSFPFSAEVCSLQMHMEHILLNPVIWWEAKYWPIPDWRGFFFHTLAYCFYHASTLTPLLLRWFHAANNSFSIIQFIARHKWNSKDYAVANKHQRCLLAAATALHARGNGEYLFYGCLTFPLKGGSNISKPVE